MDIIFSWRNEIPKIVKNFRDGMITLFAGLIPFQDTLAEWLNMTTNQVTTICGVGILVTGVIAKMFGVTDTAVITSSSTPNPKP